MAYSNYYPATYQPMVYPNYSQMQPVQTQPVQQYSQQNVPYSQANNSITWVQGQSGAKAYPVSPNTNALLMDAESEQFFIKSVDASGMPMPLRVFEYKEVFPSSEVVDTQHSHDAPQIDTSEFATKDEIAEIKKMLDELLAQQSKSAKGEKSNGK